MTGVGVLAMVAVTLLSFSIGLQASGTRRSGGKRQWGLLARALLATLVVFPVVAVAAAWALPLSRPLGLGLVVLAIAPGPILAVRRAARHDEHGFAVRLEVWLLALGVVLVPVYVAILGAIFHRSVPLSPGAVAKVLIVRQLLPLAVGYGTGRLWPGLPMRARKPLTWVTSLLLAAVVVIVLIVTGRAIVDLGAELPVPAAFAAAGVAIGHVLGGPPPQTRPIVATFTAMRHPGLALLLASVSGDPRALVPVIVAYLLMSAGILALYALFLRPTAAA